MATVTKSRANIKSINVNRWLKNADKIDKSLRSFSRTARVLSSAHPRLINEYSKRWIVVYKGKVCADGATFESALKKADKEGCPRRDVIVRYIDKDRKAMIL